MKILFKKIMGMAFLALFVLSFSSCSGNSNYRFNANNGYYADGEFFFFVRDGEIIKLELGTGESYAIKDTDIDTKNIFGITDSYYCVDFLNENQILNSKGNFEKATKVGEIPNTKFNSIFYSQDKDFLLVYSNNKIDFYKNRAFKFEYATNVSVEKKYDAAFSISSAYSHFQDENVYTIVFFKGKKVDIFDIEIKCINADTEPKKYTINSRKKNEIVLDKQYDGYVYCRFAYDDEFVKEKKTDYLGCVEGNIIKFYDIKRGQFANVPLKGGEMSWQF